MRYGHIKLSRKMFAGLDDFWSETREFSRAEAWIDLIQTAAFRKHRKLVGNHFVELDRGEFLASLRFLAERWNWGKNRVSVFLRLLERTHKIGTVRGTPGGTVYRLVNYDTYQGQRDIERDSTRDANGTGPGQVRDKENSSKELEDLRTNPLDLDSRVVHDTAREAIPTGDREVENGKGEEPEPPARPKSFDVLGIGTMFDRLEGKVATEEVKQHTEVVRFLNALFPAKRVGQGLSSVVRTWTGRIEEHRIKRAIEEIRKGEYPGQNGSRIGWRDLDDDRRKRVVLSVMNGMLS